MKKRISKSDKSARGKGQAVIESIFALMLFVVLVCLTSSICIYLYMYFILVTAAREGSRAAAINPDLTGANAATAIAAVKSRVKDCFSQATAQSLADGQIIVSGPTGTVGSRTVSVQVNFSYTSPVNIPGFLGAPDISGFPMSTVASMRYEE